MDIRFRGKSVESGEWLPGDLVHEAVNKHGYIVDVGIQQPYELAVGVIPETVGMGTDFKDIKGVEVFTGDKVKAYKHGDLEGYKLTETITFRCGSFHFGNWNWTEFMRIFRYAEIVGNVHDEFMEVPNEKR